MGFFGSGSMFLSIRRQTIVRWENFLSDIEQAIQAFAQSRADCFWVKTQFRGDFIVTQVTKVPHFDNFPARLAETIETFPHEAGGLGNLQ